MSESGRKKKPLTFNVGDKLTFHSSSIEGIEDGASFVVDAADGGNLSLRPEYELPPGIPPSLEISSSITPDELKSLLGALIDLHELTGSGIPQIEVIPAGAIPSSPIPPVVGAKDSISGKYKKTAITGKFGFTSEQKPGVKK